MGNYVFSMVACFGDSNRRRPLNDSDNIPYEKIGDEVRSLEDEIPFDIPDSWEWVRISTISCVVTKGTTPRGGNVAYLDKGVGFLRAENVAGLNLLDKSNLKYIDESTHFGTLKRSILEPNDILITIAGTLGRTAIVNENDLPLNANQAVSIVRIIGGNSYLNLNYLVYALNSPELQKSLTVQKKITAIPNLTLEIISDCLLPIPPVAEQSRIVSVFDHCIPLLNKYGSVELDLRSLNNNFPDQLKKAILQQAIQGKLVQQDPTDEPAVALLGRIWEQKRRLVKEGKIKSDKHESVIFRRDNSHYEKRDTEEVPLDDILPFDIPDSWVWVRLSDLVVKEIRRGKSPTYVPHSGVMVFAQKCNVKAGGINMGLAQYLDESTLKKYLDEEYLCDGDIVINSTGNGTLGRIGVFHDSDRIDDSIIVADSHVTVIRLTDTLCFEYVLYALKYYQPYLEKQGSGSTNQTELKPTVIAELLIPLPPLAEQRHIANTISASLQKANAL